MACRETKVIKVILVGLVDLDHRACREFKEKMEFRGIKVSKVLGKLVHRVLVFKVFREKMESKATKDSKDL